MPTYDPSYNPIQPDDAKWNAEMARKEEERRARGTMPTTIVGANGASPGKNIYGRTPEEEKAYREDLARRRGGAPAQPASSAQPAASGTGDAFGDFRAQQQAENRRRIASDARSRANAALAQFEAQDAEEAKAKAALRQSQNDKAYTLWTALGGSNDRVLGMAANDFAKTFNEQMQGRGEIVGTDIKERDDGKGGKERYFIFTAKMPDGTTKPFTYGRRELQDKLMRHGYSELSFADEPAAPPEAPAKPAMSPEQREKIIGTVLARYKPEFAADILKGYGIEGFDPATLNPAPVEPPAKPAADAKPEDEYDLYQKFAAETTEAGRDILMRRAQKAGFNTSKWGAAGDGRAPVAPPKRDEAAPPTPPPPDGDGKTRRQRAEERRYWQGGVGGVRDTAGWIVREGEKNVRYNHKDLENRFASAAQDRRGPISFDGTMSFMTPSDKKKLSDYLGGEPFVQFDMKKISDENTKKMIRSAFPKAVELGGLLRVREDEFQEAQEWVSKGFGFREDYDKEVHRRAAVHDAATKSKEARKREEEARKRAREAAARKTDEPETT